ncbi:response regulator transcription factor [Nocardioides sp. GY 10113]|uniref:response regulator transcription factor n=1 Tax=Nocardioides sp. GY 10113 TaxID=2569761 RepID=UPI0010A812E1|nr:response regulator transcription factor [Nocardioides sp. GY 10113]TIC80658.1 response regulator transcription factor [Nocardioides sp. GY 10113]
MASVLVVDDDPTVREVVATYLRANAHEVTEAEDGEAAVEAMARRPADLVVLDLMLPGIDGLEVCRRIRATREVPIIMLTALGDEVDRVTGLEVGADDYVSKPFSPRELVLRVESVLRRTSGREPGLPDLLRDGDLVVDHLRREATRAGERLVLTAREYDLLRYLVAHPGIAFSRDDLLESVWGWSIGDRSTVTVHVRRLREKVEDDPTSPVRLVTVWGIGYLWEAAESASSAALPVTGAEPR